MVIWRTHLRSKSLTTAFHDALEWPVPTMGEDMTLEPRHRTGGFLVHLAANPQTTKAFSFQLALYMHSLMREEMREIYRKVQITQTLWSKISGLSL